MRFAAVVSQASLRSIGLSVGEGESVIVCLVSGGFGSGGFARTGRVGCLSLTIFNFPLILALRADFGRRELPSLPLRSASGVPRARLTIESGGFAECLRRSFNNS